MNDYLKLIVVAYTILPVSSAYAGIASETVEQTAKVVIRKFAGEIAEEGVEAFSKRLAAFSLKYGDDGLKAVQKSGPSAMRIAAEAGEHAPEACKLLAGYGDDAISIATDPQLLKAMRTVGGDAAAAAMKHGRVALPVCDELGKAGAQALKNLNSQNGRRLGMMLNDGSLTKIGTSEQVLNLLKRSGDKAMEFLWKNKISLAVAGTAVAFWSNPDPFIDGIKELLPPITDPITQPLKEVAKEAATNTNWTFVISLLAVMVCGITLLFVRPFVTATTACAGWLVTKLDQPQKDSK